MQTHVSPPCQKCLQQVCIDKPPLNGRKGMYYICQHCDYPNIVLSRKNSFTFAPYDSKLNKQSEYYDPEYLSGTP